MANLARETIRCGGCNLNQFVTLGGRCRRCHQPFTKAETIPPEPRRVEVYHPAPITFYRAYSRESTLRRLPDTFRLIRLTLGYSQKALAERAGWTRTYVSKLESGKCAPNMRTVMRFAALFGFSLGFLFQMVECAAEAEG